MPVLICLRKKNSERRLILQRIKCQPAPSSHVQKLKSRFGIKVKFSRHNRVRKYASYFKGMEILSILELVAETEQRLFHVITDIRTKRLAGIKREKLLKSAGILCQYFCWQSFTTWDVWLLWGELAMILCELESPCAASQFDRMEMSSLHTWVSMEALRK